MKSFFEKYGALFMFACLIGAFVLVAIVGYKGGARITAQVYELRITKMQRDQSQAVSKAQGEAADAKDKAATAIAAADSKHRKETTDAKATADRIIADLRAGTVRLRREFTCPASAVAVRADDVATSAGGTDGAGPGAGSGLSAAHVEFLIRESERADAALAKVNALRAVVRADRGQ